MKIKKANLLAALKAVKPGVSDKEVIQDSNHFIFDEDKIRSYNDQIAIHKIFKTGLCGAVKASEFYSLIDKITVDEMEIFQESGQFKIEAGNLEAAINIQEQHAVPLINVKGLKGWMDLPGNFSDAIEFCTFSASKDMTKPVLTCLFIIDNKVYSSDRFRVTRFKLDDNVGESFLLKESSAKILKSYNPTHYLPKNDWIHFKNKDDVYFSSRVTLGEYPDLDQYFVTRGTRINLPDDLKSIIDRVQIMTNSDFKQDLNIKIEIIKGKITCKGEGDLGYVKESTKTSYDGKDITFKIHPIFLKDILETLNELIVTQNSLLFKGDGFDHIISLFG